MKNIKILFLSLIVMFSQWGCSDWLDINDDPNYISELQSPQVVLPSVQVNIATGLMGWDTGFGCGYWSQYWTQAHNSSQFKYLDGYKETSFSNSYSNIVPTALINLKELVEGSEVGSETYLIGEVLSIYMWQIVTDTWGDIPYFDALKGAEYTFSPAFDSQEDIYIDLANRIDNLLAVDFSEAYEITEKYDFIYEGDIDMWLAFAKSLKLKLMLRLSETAGYSNTELVQLVNAGGFITSSAMVPGSIWENKDTKRHPMKEFSSAGYFDNVIASKTFIAWLEHSSDPRIDALFAAPGTGHRGSLQGDYAHTGDVDGNGTPDDSEDYSTALMANDLDIPLMTTWEVDFYIAEVYARVPDNANAKLFYDAGIQASCDYWGVTNTLTNAAGTGTAEWLNGTVDQGLEQIGIQKWVSYCNLQHVEAFIERNRLKYPAVNIVDVAQNRTDVYENFPAGEFTISVEGRAKLGVKLPSSPIYPNAVVTRNTTKPSQKVSLGEKVWWDKKAEIER